MKRLLIIFFSFFLMASGSVDKQSYDTNAKVKSIFVYNFTKYIDWPQEYKQGDFTIGFLGQSPLYDELKKMSITKKVVNQPLKVQKFASIGEITKCHMLVITNENAHQIKEIINKVKGFSTLVITEKDGLAKQGAGINFVVQNSRQKFELNRSNIESQNLQVSSGLLALAIVVD